MQLTASSAFHTTHRAAARSDQSTIDFAFLPELDLPAPSAQSVALRYPLLPDNFAEVRAPTLFAPEAVDPPLRAPEIVVLDPAADVVSALSEVEGMGPDGVELRWFGGEEQQESAAEYAGGMLTDLWKGLVDDLSGGAKGKLAI